jgi:hypothetical protein
MVNIYAADVKIFINCQSQDTCVDRAIWQMPNFDLPSQIERQGHESWPKWFSCNNCSNECFRSASGYLFHYEAISEDVSQFHWLPRMPSASQPFQPDIIDLDTNSTFSG